MSFNRMIPFLLLNILVSAIVVVTILAFWDRRNRATIPTTTRTALFAPTLVVPTNSPTNQAIPVQAEQPAGQAETAVQPTPIPDTNSGPTNHTVVSGESLGAISVKYDISMDEIMQANNLTDPNQLQVGQVLLIPLEDLDVPIVEPTAEPSSATVETQPPTTQPDPTAVPTIAIATGDSTIELYAASGIGDLATEQIELINSGENTVELTGWTITNSTGQSYTFSNRKLFGSGGGIIIFSRAGDDDVLSLYWGAVAPLWASGETVTLRDANGQAQTTFVIP